MADKSRIPRSIPEFNPYISNTNNYLLAGVPITNGVRLGLLETEIARWTGLFTSWSSLYPLYADKRYTRTTDVKDQLLSIMSDCVRLDQDCHLLDRIAASPNVTVSDLEVFNIKKGALQKSTHSVPTTRLTDLVVASIQPLSGGSISIKCKSNTGGGTAIIDGADSVQCVYKVGATAPVSTDDDGLKTSLSTKASFSLDLGSGNTAKYLYIYFRWYSTKHPELVGPWSSLQTMLIL
jgi:hypothetical protein